jgi:RNA polymerase sigma factor (sigma-70 family)
MTGQAITMAAAGGALRRDARERLEALFDTHHQRLYRLARRLTRNAEDARDLVQETFLRAARAPQSVPDGMPGEEAWLVRVLINMCRDRWRKSSVRKRSAHHQPHALAAGSSPEAAVMARAMIERALEWLPPRRRAIVVMYEMEGVAIPAIAALLGVAPVTVRWHLSRGRRELARALGTEWRGR